MRQVAAAIVGLAVRNVAHNWASRQAIEPWLAQVIGYAAGTCASAAVLRL